MRLQHGGVGFYPNSAHSFVHLDAGSVRAWPRMTRGQLMALFPDGKTVHLPTDNKPLARYEEARAEILAKGGAVAGMAYASAEDSGGRRSLWATLFGGGDEDEDFYGTRGGRGGRSRAAQEAAAYVPSSSGDDAGTRGVLAFAAPEPSRGLTRRSRPRPRPKPPPRRPRRSRRRRQRPPRTPLRRSPRCRCRRSGRATSSTSPLSPSCRCRRRARSSSPRP